MNPSRNRTARRGLALLLASAIWLPCLHLFYHKDAGDFTARAGVSREARQLQARQMQFWTDPKLRQVELARMRGSNAEWDFMGRSYLVWSLANIGLRDPASKAQCLEVMDQIIGETIRLEKERGLYFFLMPYARDKAWMQKPDRSQFIDGEIALMLGLRRALEEKAEYKALLTERVNKIVARMTNSPSLSAESYPDECWTFCNVVALDSIKTADYLDGTDHSALLKNWVANAKRMLVDPKSGLLISSYSLDGHPVAGPEGSSIWMVAHCLQLVDEDFAQDQYRRARTQLGRNALGFGYAAEWPKSWRNPANVDSGPVILDISPGSTGMAFLGASSFDDRSYLSSLATTIDFAAFPVLQDNRLKYSASNQVGDAVLLYSSVLGPMWTKIKSGVK
jgi:hypothetical protein